MLYFRPHVRALEAHIADLQVRLAASEAERASLLDRLLEKHRIQPLTAASQPPTPVSPRVIAPPWAGPEEVQDAARQVWIQEEAAYLMENAGIAEDWRARSEAERRYNEQHGVIAG